jgi:ABC-type nitrate/sulfonate/bicarbonate transport systems, periplasmic components
VVAERKRKDQEPVTFGMTFPFSTHNYHLRFWMAAGGVDPDEDVRLVVLPPPYMVESLANKHVEGFCVGAPWNSVAVDLGIGFILHFVSDILACAAEKVLAVRSTWAQENPGTLAALVRAHGRAATFIEDVANRDEVCALLAAPNRSAEPPRSSVAHSTAGSRSRPTEQCGRASAICASAGPAPRGLIRCTRHGSTARWFAGDKPSSLLSISRQRKPCSGPTSTT